MPRYIQRQRVEQHCCFVIYLSHTHTHRVYLCLAAFNDQLQVLLDETNVTIKRAQDFLKQMDNENRTFEGGTGEKRIRETQFQNLARSLRLFIVYVILCLSLTSIYNQAHGQDSSSSGTRKQDSFAMPRSIEGRNSDW